MAMTPVCLYLAGPIDGISDEEARGWRSVVANLNRGVLFFDPTTAWHGAGADTAAAVDAGNRAMIRHCDGLLVNLSGPGRGFGTCREVEYARSLGKPVSVFTGGMPLVSLLTHDLMVSVECSEAHSKLLRAVEGMDDV